MKKTSFKVLSLLLVATMLFSVLQISSVAVVDYKITNPYESVTAYLGSDNNHYKTNLHTHSTYSDADIDLSAMVKGFYNQNYDVLAISDHGVIGVEWDETPTLLALYQYNHILLNDQSHLSTEEYEAILNGTYKDDHTTRTNKRGMQSVTGAIEGNYLVAQKNHINGYFMNNNSTEGVMGNEGDFETMVKMIEDAGGISHINHPGDWLGSAGDPDIARDPGNVQYFANLMRKYDSCLGIEVYNAYDRPTSSDRILWDELLKVVIPEGRNVWGFGNSDAHNLFDIDTAFMDFVMPSYSDENLRTAMENGTFFSVSRYEAGERIGNGEAYPQVTAIMVDESADTITIIGRNCDTINWIADGEVIKTATGKNGVTSSTIKLRSHADDISCYVRAELQGEGGKTLTQAFVCDDGNMDDLINRGPANTTVPVDFIQVLRSLINLILRTANQVIGK